MNPIIIKLSGKSLAKPTSQTNLWDAIRAANTSQPIVIVHGGGPQVDEMLDALGHETRRVDGIRVTPEEQMEIVAGVLGGRVNLELVGALRASGIEAVGLALASSGVLECSLKSPELGRVGVGAPGDAPLVRHLVEIGVVPVVSSIGADASGGLLNVNADDAAAALAVSLHAPELIFVSDVEGVRDASGQTLEQIGAHEIEGMIERGDVLGGMAAKLRAGAMALTGGAKRVVVTDIPGLIQHLGGERARCTKLEREGATS